MGIKVSGKAKKDMGLLIVNGNWLESQCKEALKFEAVSLLLGIAALHSNRELACVAVSQGLIPNDKSGQ